MSIVAGFLRWWRGLAPRDARALRIAGIVVGTALLYSGLLRPVLAGFARQRAQVAQERDLYRREVDVLARRTAFDAALRRGAAALQDRSPWLFTGRDSVTASADLVAYVTELAANTGVVVQGSDAAAPSLETDGLLRVRIEVRAVSDLPGLTAWLDWLEQGEKLVRVAELVVIPSVQIGVPSSGGEVLSVTLVAEGFALVAPDRDEPRADRAGTW